MNLSGEDVNQKLRQFMMNKQLNLAKMEGGVIQIETGVGGEVEGIALEGVTME